MANPPIGKLDHIGIAVKSVAEARKFFGAPKVAPGAFAAYLQPLRPNEAQARFLGRFAELDAA